MRTIHRRIHIFQHPSVRARLRGRTKRRYILHGHESLATKIWSRRHGRSGLYWTRHCHYRHAGRWQLRFTLLWAVAFSVIATLVLQEMTCRLGVIGKLGLGDAIVQKTQRAACISPLLSSSVPSLLAMRPMKPATSQALPLDYRLSASWDQPLGVLIGLIAFALLASEKFH